jgi:hypothetical protein
MVSALGYSSPPPMGSAVNVFYIDDGLSQTSGTARQGAHRRCFLALMVGAPGSPTPPPREGPTIGVFALMVGTPGPPALPLGGPPLTFFSVDGGHSRISGTAS